MRRGVDLRRFYLAAIAGLALLLAALFALVLRSTREAVEHGAEQLRRAASDKASTHVGVALSVAETAVLGVNGLIAEGLVTPEEPEALEAALYAELLRQPSLTEMTFTWPDGQLAVVRLSDADGKARVITRRRGRTVAGWTLDVRPRPPGGGFTSAGFVEGISDGLDPTAHPTYTTPVELKGEAVWSDLAFSELDLFKPLAERRIVMTVQKAVLGEGGRLVGVLRAGLLSDGIDRIGALRVDEDNPADPHRIFLCDRKGQLVTRLDPGDRFVVTGYDDVRVAAQEVPPAIAAALDDSAIGTISLSAPLVERTAGQVVTISPLRDDRTRGWLVGVAVPESFYLAGLTAARDRLLVVAALLMLGVLAGGALSLRAVRAGLARIVGETARMRRFDFAPAPARTVFADVNDALDSLEVAKTALRAMGRYVPVDLVRQLYREGREPALGSELVDLSIMFTDIEDFTALSEKLSPDELAAALGAYLEVMSAAIVETGGTIDKFIGDAVMVFWNAPLPAEDHVKRACGAALRCSAELRRLYDSEGWAGRPRWTTRFGLHRAKVRVGHFGAPDRLSYTALGDGVNLASRIEGLNKLYGTRILVSEAVWQVAREDHQLRRIDRVAVKGREEPIWVYELLEAAAAVRPYEEAHDRYREAQFREALAILDGHEADPPCARLAVRCRELAERPPAVWDGVTRAVEK